MSDGKKHHELWRKGWKIALPLSFLTYAITDPVTGYICSQAGCLSVNSLYAGGLLLGYGMGRYVDPDMDLVGATNADGRLINEIPILGVFLFGHWATYGAIFRKHHRSFWTHFPGVSTAIRIFYQFYPLFFILWLKDWNFPWIYHLMFGIFLGLSYADFLHWREDKRSSKNH